jgi:SAM-dependent methyltransferase
MRCPLCSFSNCSIHAEDRRSRAFFLCGSCGLIFVPARYHLTPEKEKERYALHHNTPDNREYAAYLSKIADEVMELAGPHARICDFGSGGEHVLADILTSRGARCIAHDPLYGLTVEAGGAFDIVAACESFEHLRDPRQSLEFIRRLLKPGGTVYVRTHLYNAEAAEKFSGWWYAQDKTHICFFCMRTMDAVAGILGREIIRTNGKDTIVFGRK